MKKSLAVWLAISMTMATSCSRELARENKDYAFNSFSNEDPYSQVPTGSSSEVALSVFTGTKPVPSQLPELNVFIMSPNMWYLYDKQSKTFEYGLRYDEFPRAAYLNALADYWRRIAGVSNLVILAAPATYGSGGELRWQHEWRGIEVISGALDHLKESYGSSRVNVAGHSATASLAVALATVRDDIGCAVGSSGPYDQPRLIKSLGWPSTYLGVTEPISIASRLPLGGSAGGGRIVLLADPRDTSVPFEQSARLHDLLVASGRQSQLLSLQAPDERHHVLRNDAIRRLGRCVAEAASS